MDQWKNEEKLEIYKLYENKHINYDMQLKKCSEVMFKCL